MSEKPIFDIFSRKKLVRKDVKGKKIVVDYREKNCLVASFLIKQGFDVEFCELKVADYIVGGIAIERKSVPDFVSSMVNKRLLGQIDSLKQYEDKLIIVEGIEDYDLYSIGNVSSNAVRGFLLSIVLKYKVPVIFSRNQEDTARFISLLSRKKERGMSMNVCKKPRSKREQLRFILEGFPSVGPVNSKKLLERFGSIKGVMNASLEEVREVIGKKADVFVGLRDGVYKN